jgi:Domain of Unknown Function (DUF1080)
MKVAASIALLTVLAITQDVSAQSAAKEGARPLFNGKNLDGWEHVGPGKMVLEDGMIRTEGGMGLLWYTREKLGDCTIRVVYKTTSKVSNSGVFIRIAEKPKDEWYAVHHGYEVQICDGTDEYHRTGAIYSLSKATASPSKIGEWNTMDITLKGQRVIVTLNGVKVQDFDPETATIPERKKNYEPERGPRPASGYFGLQNHDDYSKGAEVYFKEVSVRPLDK